MHRIGILMHMRTTLIIDQRLLDEARELTGIREKTALVRAGLEALIAREPSKRLALLGGTQPKLSDILRRRPAATPVRSRTAKHPKLDRREPFSLAVLLSGALSP